MLIPFDILYEGFCNKLRSAGKSEAILQLIKKQNTETSRIRALLEQETDLYSLLQRNISDSFERKDESMAKKLWQRGSDGQSAELLTEALSYSPISSIYENKVAVTFDGGEALKKVLQSFVGCAMSENRAEVSITATILYDRACILFGKTQYRSAFQDFLQAWLLGFSKTLDLAYRVAVCCYESGALDTSKELLQCAAQHLRQLQISNEDKSSWTMSIVKVLKAIEIVRKQQPNKISQSDGLQLSVPPLISSDIAATCEPYSGRSVEIESASNTLDMKFSPEKGRHIIAKQNIPPGSTIIAEMPYAWTMSKGNYHKFCLWCLRRTDTGLPCTSCASAIFCNTECRQNAMKAFHGQECSILKLLDSSQKLGNMALLCFRTVLATEISAIQEFASKTSQESLPERLVMGLSEKGVLDSSSYASVFAQTPNSEQRQAGDLLKRTFSAIYLTLCLKYVGYFGKSTPTESLESAAAAPETGNSELQNIMSDNEIGVAALILRHLQSTSCNAYGINYIHKKADMCGADETKNLQIDEIGGATYPAISITNHSCSPNAYRINIPGRMCLVKTLREISSGEEIYDGYGPLYLTEARHERISKLQTQYFFRCGCPPCLEDWPSYANLRKAPIRYKCSSCLCELKIGGNKGMLPNKVKCPYCDKVMDMKKLATNLGAKKDSFSLAKTSILAEAFQPFDKDIENVISEYIQQCQKVYLDPCIYTVEAQEILKLFWNLSIRNC